MNKTIISIGAIASSLYLTSCASNNYELNNIDNSNKCVCVGKSTLSIDAMFISDEAFYGKLNSFNEAKINLSRCYERLGKTIDLESSDIDIQVDGNHNVYAFDKKYCTLDDIKKHL